MAIECTLDCAEICQKPNEDWKEKSTGGRVMRRRGRCIRRGFYKHPVLPSRRLQQKCCLTPPAFLPAVGFPPTQAPRIKDEVWVSRLSGRQAPLTGSSLRARLPRTAHVVALRSSGSFLASVSQIPKPLAVQGVSVIGLYTLIWQKAPKFPAGEEPLLAFRAGGERDL